MKKIILALFILIMLTGCGDRLSPEEVYQNAISQMEDAENIYMDRTQNIRVQQDSFSSRTVADITYYPFEAQMEAFMNLVNLSGGLHLEMQVDENTWRIRNKESDTWEERPAAEFQDEIILQPASPLLQFEGYQEEFLMKEDINGNYEVSFRAGDAQYYPLVLDQLKQMGIFKQLGIEPKDMQNTIEIDRIEMTATIHPETFEVLYFFSRARYLVELAGEYKNIDQSLTINYVKEENQ